MSAVTARATVLAVVVASTVLSPAMAARTAPPRPSGPPPFCISRGGGDGASGVYTDCRYYDYQSCIQAAIERGNCVRNINAR
ncbi:hypothetical protein [Bradyrhizobium sp. 2TAF24]|uniref:hypothetical protein n=1 Tax=Bradyrhizobium sp. 2TAF24 TaxID=3233011 RepID=UPI003F8E89BF